MSKLYDVIIIGASKEGIDAYLTLKKANINAVVVSPNFNNTTVGFTVAKADRIYSTVVYTQFKHGLFTFTLADNSFICATKVIIASGLRPKQTDNTNISNFVCYNLKDLKSKARNIPIVLYGNSPFIVGSALKLAKNYNYIYIVNPEASLHCDKQSILEINHAKNIVVLPLCNIMEGTINKAGKLLSVKLDTFETLACGSVLADLGRESDITNWFDKTFLQLDSKGLIKVSETFMVQGFPDLYAIGTCASTQSDISSKLAANHILSTIHKEDR